jgi:tRNA dimethylallyltransferase
MQLYRDLAVLTARPGAAELARAPHRLYGMLDGDTACSAALWAGLARTEIAAAAAAGKLPIVVGGTGLYLRILMGGIAEVPPIPPEIRQASRDRHAGLGGAGFHAELAGLDPIGAARLNPGDTQRLIRAHEVVVATGRPLHVWQTASLTHGRSAPENYEAVRVVMLPAREALYRACDQRFEAMLAAGALEEVRRLRARGLDPGLPVMKALGVPELARYLAGEIDLSEAVVQAQQSTRRYAKRQTTWFRHQMAAPDFTATQFSERISDQICSFIRKTGLTSTD